MIHFSQQTETHLDIPLRDGKKLHAILRGEFSDSTPVAIIMHGRPGTGNELLPYMASHYMGEADVATLRLFMYDFGSDYRTIFDCTLDTHIADFEDVVQYVRQQTKAKLFAVGHSYGGITILGSSAQLDGAVLWDPTHGLAFNNNPDFNTGKYPETILGNFVIGTGGCGYVYASKQATYDDALGDTTEWAKEKSYPTKFILAGAGPLAKYARLYHEAANEPKALVEIADAHHAFEDNDAVIEKLLAETLGWIKSYSQ